MIKLNEYVSSLIVEELLTNQDIYADFECDHKLTDEEIAESFNKIFVSDEIIDEGLLNIFNKIKGLFTRTKKFALGVKDIFKGVPEKIKTQWEAAGKEMSEKDINDMIDSLIAAGKKAGKNLDKKTVVDLINKIDPTNREQVTNLCKNLKLGTKDSDLENIANLFGYIQNTTDEVKETVGIKTKDEYKPSDEATPSDEGNTKENIKDAIADAEKPISEWCKAVKVEPEKVANTVAELAKDIPELKNQSSNVYKGVAFMVMGGYLASKLDSDAYTGYISALASIADKGGLNKLIK